MNVLKFIGGYMLAGTAVQMTVMGAGYMMGKREAKKVQAQRATETETKGEE